MKLILILLFSTSLWAQSHLPQTYRFYKDGSQQRFEFSQFQTDKFIDNLDQDQALGNGESFTERDFVYEYRYGLADGLNMAVGIKGRQVQAIDQVGSETQDFGATGLHSLYSELAYTFDRLKNWEYAVMFGFGKTLFAELEAAELTNNAPLGDPGFFYHMGGALTYYLTEENFLTSKFLYRNPAKNLSQEFYYQAELTLLWPKFALFGGLEGVFSMQTDEYGSNPASKPSIGIALSNRYNSINRNFTEFYGGLGFNITKNFRTEFKFSSTAAVNRYDIGNTMLFTLAYLNNDQKEKKIEKEFKNYRVEGEVLKISPKGKYLIIDKGLSHDVTRGMVFHIFINDYQGSSRLVAIAKAIKVQSSKSIIQILKRYSKRKIEAGFIVRGGQIR